MKKEVDNMSKPYIIGIAGGTGSGKTTLANRIKDEFKEKVIVLSHDFYYKSLDTITKEEREQLNYDCPEMLETDFMIKQIKDLINGKQIQRPIYSYSDRLRDKNTVTVNPAPVIVLEGILIFENEELLNLMDLKIFVDTDADIRLTRLVDRDIKHRGASFEYLISKYKSTIKPMHEKYVEPCKKKADIIIPANNDDNEIGFNVIIEKVRNILR